jgi:hypothetical protein
MMGVTGFGLFLTPVFYVVIRGLAARKRPTVPAVAEHDHGAVAAAGSQPS